MFFAGGETVTVIRPATRDRTGDRTGDPTPHTIEGCAFALSGQSGGQSSTSTDSDRRETYIATAQLICPPGADIRAGDFVQTTPDGPKYLVDGLTWQPHNPFTGWEPGVIVRLKGVV